MPDMCMDVGFRIDEGLATVTGHNGVTERHAVAHFVSSFTLRVVLVRVERKHTVTAPCATETAVAV